MGRIKLSPSRINSQRSAAPEGAVEIAIIRLLLDVGFQHKRIAALFDCNQGRIAEVATKQTGPEYSYGFAVRVMAMEDKDDG